MEILKYEDIISELQKININDNPIIIPIRFYNSRHRKHLIKYFEAFKENKVFYYKKPKGSKIPAFILVYRLIHTIYIKQFLFQELQKFPNCSSMEIQTIIRKVFGEIKTSGHIRAFRTTKEIDTKINDLLKHYKLDSYTLLFNGLIEKEHKEIELLYKDVNMKQED